MEFIFRCRPSKWILKHNIYLWNILDLENMNEANFVIFMTVLRTEYNILYNRRIFKNCQK